MTGVSVLRTRPVLVHSAPLPEIENHSMAYAGPCTGAGGYISNAELHDIIQNHGNYSIVKSYIDRDSDSNILM
jgi:hypothetical protein